MSNRYFLTGAAKASLAACAPADALEIQARLDNVVELASSDEGIAALRSATRSNGSRLIMTVGSFAVEFSVSGGNPVLFIHQIRLERPRPEAG